MKLLFPPRYFASIDYYAAMMAAEEAVIDTTARYDKRCKAVHRAEIADTHGRLQLTVPVCRGRDDFAPGTRPLWRDRVVSGHGRWWDVHRIALESAYGRTPYFEFYIDRLLPYLSEASVGRSIVDFDADLDAQVRAMLHLDTPVTLAPAAEHLDAVAYDELTLRAPEPYWQVRADKHGFIAGLSILDLLFNLGPEALIILTQRLP